MVNIWTIFSQISGGGCPLCRRPGDGLCGACAQALPFNHHPCPSCALPLPATAPTGTACVDCQGRERPFEQVLAPLLYLPPVDHLVAGFKYQQQLHLGRVLAKILAESIPAADRDVQLLLPVPLQARRLSERGFNQAAELARWLSAYLNIPWAGGRLIRVRDGDHQQASRRSQRRLNVRGAFSCRSPMPRRVALIDDVMTSGATAEEACRTLRRAGVERIDVWTVARTPHERWNATSDPWS